MGAWEAKISIYKAPDLVVRVFNKKVEELKADLFKHGRLGRAVTHVYTIKFQKRGLPHMHMIVFLHHDSKLQTPEHIDSLLSAEFPDEDREPELLELVKKYMVHTPCGHNNPTAPCMKDVVLPKFSSELMQRTGTNRTEPKVRFSPVPVLQFWLQFGSWFSEFSKIPGPFENRSKFTVEM